MQHARLCRDCGAPIEGASALCEACRGQRLRKAWARLDRQRHAGKWVMALGALWLVLLFAGMHAQWWAASPMLLAIAGIGGLLFFGGGFAWLAAWAVQAFHRDKGGV